MDQISCREFPSIRALDGLSAKSQEDHYRLYCGYVSKYNQLHERFASAAARAQALEGEYLSLKLDLTYALSAIKNHELYFAMLDGGGAAAPDGTLAAALEKHFGGLPHYLRDLKQAALASRGWAWTTYDLEHHFLFNYSGTTQQALPVWNAVPLLAIDMYGHAYLYDYGNDRAAYVDAVVRNLDWPKIAARYAQVCAMRPPT